jgi:hypothetical protein
MSRETAEEMQEETQEEEDKNAAPSLEDILKRLRGIGAACLLSFGWSIVTQILQLAGVISWSGASIWAPTGFMLIILVLAFFLYRFSPRSFEYSTEAGDAICGFAVLWMCIAKSLTASGDIAVSEPATWIPVAVLMAIGIAIDLMGYRASGK